MKGNGWMMAMAATKAIEETIPCPLCGKGMTWEMVAWFCRAGTRRGEHNPTRSPCMRVPDEAIARFRRSTYWQEGYQFFADPHEGVPVIHAVAVLHDRVIAKALFVRGAGGHTNFTAQCCEAEPEEVVAFFGQGGQWEMAPWFEDDLPTS